MDVTIGTTTNTTFVVDTTASTVTFNNGGFTVSHDQFTAAPPVVKEAVKPPPPMPPTKGTTAWRRRRKRGEALLLELFTKKERADWERERALKLDYGRPNMHGARWLLVIESELAHDRAWEFSEGGEILHKRNLYPLNANHWSYEDMVATLLLWFRSDRATFYATGCRDHAEYHMQTSQYAKALGVWRALNTQPRDEKGRFVSFMM